MVRKIAIAKQCPAGVVYIAPAGTPLPANATDKLNAAFKNVADLNEDGITRSTDVDTTDINNMSGDKVASFVASYEETFQFIMLETNADTLRARYGSDRVNATGDELISYTTGMPKNEHVSIVADVVLAGLDKKQRIVIPDAVLGDTGDVQYHSGDALSYDVTFNTFPDIKGNNSYNYFAPLTAEPAPAESH